MAKKVSTSAWTAFHHVKNTVEYNKTKPRMITSRVNRFALLTRSAFSFITHHVNVVHIQKLSHFSHSRCGFLPVVCTQISRTPTLSRLLLGCQFYFYYYLYFSVVCRLSDSLFSYFLLLEVVIGVLVPGRVFHQLLDGQMVNENTPSTETERNDHRANVNAALFYEQE